MVLRSGRRVVELTFGSEKEAHDALERALELQRQRVIVVHDAVVVSRSPHGWLELDEPVDVTAIAVAVPAILFGAFVGTLIAGPLGFLVGAIVAGGIGVLVAKAFNQGISDRKLVEIERRALPGQSILALQVGTADAAEVGRRIPMTKTMLASVVFVAASATSTRADDQNCPPTEPEAEEPQEQALPPPPAPSPVPQPVDVPLTDTQTTTPVLMVEPRGNWYDPDRIGFGITAGGGASGFTGDTMRDNTKDGGNWDVRAMIGTRLPLTLEASYLGSAQSIDALGLDNNAILIGNGVQGDVRLNATTDLAVQPFIYGGVAWRRYSIENASFNTSDINDKDDVLELPVGLGVAYKSRGFMLDARAEYRGSFQENLAPAGLAGNAFTDPASLNRWGINANIGYEF
jgi:uncharacterized membrane protein